MGIIKFNINGKDIEFPLGTAQFGPILFHGSLYHGPLAIVTNPMNTEISTGCSYFDSFQREAVRDKAAVVLRGDCTFLVKASHAQAAGAKLLLVVNNSTQTMSSMESTEKSSFRIESHNQIDTILIPSFIISSEGFEYLENSNLDDIEISSILSKLLDKSTTLKEKLQFSNLDIENLVIHHGELIQLPMDNLYRNDYYIPAFSFRKPNLQSFENICKI